jgi:hypothetical protein
MEHSGYSYLNARAVCGVGWHREHAAYASYRFECVFCKRPRILSLAQACRHVSAKAVVTAAVASHWTEDLVAVSYWTAGASSALPSQLAAAVAAAAAVTSHKYVLPSANFRPKT